MNNKIIAFAGRKRSGKDLLSNAIVEYNTTVNNKNTIILTVAAYLKNLCCELLSIDNATLLDWKDSNKTFNVKPTDRWFNLISLKTGIEKEKVVQELSTIEITNVRQLLQVLGTDIIRKYNPNWHVECLMKDILEYKETHDIIIDDVRFPNEREMIEKMGGSVYYIIRPDYFDISNHISETSLKWQHFKDENIIINNLPKNIMETYIKMWFANNCNISLPIFLSNNTFYKDDYNANFPNRDSALLQDILKQCKTDILFKERGIIHYHSNNRKLITEFNNEVLYSDCNNWRKDFILYNPLINENLKLYL